MKAAHEIVREAEHDGEAESWAILKLRNRGSGVPFSIVVDGSVKCLACDGYSHSLICTECREAVNLLRSAGNLNTIRRVVEFFEVPGMLQVLKLLTDDVVADLMAKRIEDARNGN